MALDKVKPLKLESPDTGGTEDDQFPTSLNPSEDYVECRGIVLDDATNADESTVISRDDDDMLFQDGSNPTAVTLSSLIAGAGGLTITAHRIVRHGIHFIKDGPADGFASGAYKETTYSGIKATAEVWWESGSKLKKIVSLDTTWTGIKKTTEVWKVYDTDGSTVLATVTDTITYSGLKETSRTRAIA
jgi:hypothetical protein